MKKQQRFTRSAIALACMSFLLPLPVTAWAVTTACQSTVSSILFSEDFSTALSSSKWKVDSTGGSVISGGGKVTVNGSAGGRFPYVQTVGTTIPSTGDFSLYCKGKYLHIGSSGTGMCVMAEKVITPGSVWWTFDGGSGGSLWGTSFGFGTGTTKVTTTVPDVTSVSHEFEICVVGSTVTTYVDGVQVKTGDIPVTWSRPQYIWFGNPVLGGSDWSTFETNKIEVRALGGKNTTTSPTQSTNLIDAILSNNRAALNYSTNTLTVPTLDIPQAGSSPLTFSSTWKATNATAPNAVFYLTDAQQIANVSSPTATFDPVTFTVNMPNVITSGSSNGTDGLAAQKYQVIVEGSTLGLVRMGATLNCTPPQVTQNGQCVTPALNFKLLGTHATLSGRPVVVSLYGSDVGKVASATLEGNNCSVSSQYNRSGGTLKTFECPSPFVTKWTPVEVTLNYTDGTSARFGTYHIYPRDEWITQNGQFST